MGNDSIPVSFRNNMFYEVGTGRIVKSRISLTSFLVSLVPANWTQLLGSTIVLLIGASSVLMWSS